jgi:hypothetical protein
MWKAPRSSSNDREGSATAVAATLQLTFKHIWGSALAINGGGMQFSL